MTHLNTFSNNNPIDGSVETPRIRLNDIRLHCTKGWSRISHCPVWTLSKCFQTYENQPWWRFRILVVADHLVTLAVVHLLPTVCSCHIWMQSFFSPKVREISVISFIRQRFSEPSELFQLNFWISFIESQHFFTTLRHFRRNIFKCFWYFRSYVVVALQEVRNGPDSIQ